MWIAIAHIVGAVMATIALGVAVLLLDARNRERHSRIAIQELATKTGIDFVEVFDAQNLASTIEFLSDRFSDDRFNNRLSDLCWWVMIAWGWLGAFVQLALVVAVVWYTTTDSLDNAIFAWAIPVATLFFSCSAVIFSFACRLLTGRLPGQAKRMRKGLTEIVDSRRRQSTSSRYGFAEPE